MEREVKFFWLKAGGGMLVAARPKSNVMVLFLEEEKKWNCAPQTYSQMEGNMVYGGGPDFDEISEKEAQDIFKDIRPEPVLDDIERVFRTV
ncbi:hypothetical protein [Leadbettera azotonutricia]|uniref:Uncharacterized protein n=1 Tax=Leadbettera azotonutricia (strain ATCC BAA-888 / DSM 13862 / ZAS-9) TaxID=545695 RepID=F5Y910_LEAAZ|nr:hypothetical protein [Leadbettera azotonutricia]AEF82988.1 hypothetical protein TREAZ_0872 [Leadbettera azotonutricia ZAS-9]